MCNDIPEVFSFNIEQANAIAYSAPFIPMHDFENWPSFYLHWERSFTTSKTTLRRSSHFYDHHCHRNLLYGPVSLWNILSVDVPLQDEVVYRGVGYHASRSHNNYLLPISLWYFYFFWEMSLVFLRTIFLFPDFTLLGGFVHWKANWEFQFKALFHSFPFNFN